MKTKQKTGRKTYEGDRHVYKVAPDVHKFIMQHGGGQYITDVMRIVMVSSGGKE